MTASGPRKSLWDMMGQKRSEAEPPAAIDPSSQPLPAGSTPSSNPAATSEEATLARQSEWAESASVTPAEASPKGKSLWATMQHNAQVDDSAKADASKNPPAASKASAKPIDKRLRQLQQIAAEPPIIEELPKQAPGKRIDRRLRQLEALDVEIVDEPADITPPKPVDMRLRQLAEFESPQELDDLEVEIVDEPADELDEPIKPAVPAPTSAPRLPSKIRGIPEPAALKNPSATPAEPITSLPKQTNSRSSALKTGWPKAAVASAILGAIAIPLAPLAIYPAIWSRVPASLCGFAALLLGVLALGELQRTKHKGREPLFAYAGIFMGLLAMFSGPLIFSPANLYGRWRTSYTGGHLKQIGVALDAYYQQQHSYPPGGIFQEVPGAEAPQPIHGWMTMILPYLADGQGLAKQIDLSKPYSDPVNRSVMGQTVPAFLAAGGSVELIHRQYGPAHFAGIGGLISLPEEQAAHAGVFDANSKTTRDDVTDGLSQTMIAGEISTKYPAWGEPRNWRQVGRGLNREPEGFGNAGRTGAMFLMADGSVRFLPNNTDPKVLRALSTRDGRDQR